METKPKSKSKTKKQIVDSIKNSLFHQVCTRLSDFNSYNDGLFYVSPEDIILWLEVDEYEFLCHEIFNAED